MHDIALDIGQYISSIATVLAVPSFDIILYTIIFTPDRSSLELRLTQCGPYMHGTTIFIQGESPQPYCSATKTLIHTMTKPQTHVLFNLY